MSQYRKTAQDYKNVLLQLLPNGDAWPREEGTALVAFWGSVAKSFHRANAYLTNWLEREIFPPTSVLLLPVWEQIYGLPDECGSESQLVSERQQDIAIKMFENDGLSIPMFVKLAARLGYEISIKKRFGHHCERSCEDAVGEEDWYFVWEVYAPEVTIYETTCEDICELSLRKWGNDKLECNFNRLCPPQSIVHFYYGV